MKCKLWIHGITRTFPIEAAPLVKSKEVVTGWTYNSYGRGKKWLRNMIDRSLTKSRTELEEHIKMDITYIGCESVSCTEQPQERIKRLSSMLVTWSIQMQWASGLLNSEEPYLRFVTKLISLDRTDTLRSYCFLIFIHYPNLNYCNISTLRKCISLREQGNGRMNFMMTAWQLKYVVQGVTVVKFCNNVIIY